MDGDLDMNEFKFFDEYGTKYESAGGYRNVRSIFYRPYGITLRTENKVPFYSEVVDPYLDVNLPTFIISHDADILEKMCVVDDYKHEREKALSKRDLFNDVFLENTATTLTLCNKKPFYVMFYNQNLNDLAETRYVSFKHFRDMRDFILDKDPKYIGITETSFLTDWKTKVLYSETSILEETDEYAISETSTYSDGETLSNTRYKSKDYKKLREYFLYSYVDPETMHDQVNHNEFVSYSIEAPEDVEDELRELRVWDAYESK